MAGKIIESTNLLLFQFHEFSFKKKSIYIVHYATVYPICTKCFVFHLLLLQTVLWKIST